MKPIQPEVFDHANGIAAAIDDALPDGFGFALLIFEFDKITRMNWISNAQRGDMIEALEELLSKLKTEALTTSQRKQ